MTKTARKLTDKTLKGLKSAPAGRRVMMHDTEVPGFGVQSHRSRCPHIRTARPLPGGLEVGSSPRNWRLSGD